MKCFNTDALNNCRIALRNGKHLGVIYAEKTASGGDPETAIVNADMLSGISELQISAKHLAKGFFEVYVKNARGIDMEDAIDLADFVVETTKVFHDTIVGIAMSPHVPLVYAVTTTSTRGKSPNVYTVQSVSASAVTLFSCASAQPVIIKADSLQPDTFALIDSRPGMPRIYDLYSKVTNVRNECHPKI